MQPHIVFFIGKPGSGKGTQAELLSKVTGWPVFAASNELRALAGEDTFIGRQLRQTMDAGILTPHWFPTYLYFKALFSLPADGGAIFDGFGRRPAEAEPVIESLQWLGRSFKMIYLHVSEEEVKQRLLLRREQQGRADDKVVDQRLQVYYEQTEPVIDMFRTAGALVEIRGEGDREMIAAEIRTAIGLA